MNLTIENIENTKMWLVNIVKNRKKEREIIYNVNEEKYLIVIILNCEITHQLKCKCTVRKKPTENTKDKKYTIQWLQNTENRTIRTITNESRSTFFILVMF